jgi:hypothetical protein
MRFHRLRNHFVQACESAIQLNRNGPDTGIRAGGVSLEVVRSRHPSIRRRSHANAYRPTLRAGQDQFLLRKCTKNALAACPEQITDDTR